MSPCWYHFYWSEHLLYFEKQEHVILSVNSLEEGHGNLTGESVIAMHTQRNTN
jgi:hypothetical protein